MAQQGQQRKPANATFYPGADDYYTAPEVVSPMPQRCVRHLFPKPLSSRVDEIYHFRWDYACRIAEFRKRELSVTV